MKHNRLPLPLSLIVWFSLTACSHPPLPTAANLDKAQQRPPPYRYHALPVQYTAPLAHSPALSTSEATVQPTLANLRFIVMGDTRELIKGESPLPARDPRSVRQQLAQAAALLQPAFILHTGDCVAHGASQADWRRFDQDFRPIKDIPLMVIPGNHEYRSENLLTRSPHNLHHFFQRFALPKQDLLGEALPHGPTGPYWYSFHYGPIAVIALDTNLVTDTWDFIANHKHERRDFEMVTQQEWQAELRF